MILERIDARFVLPFDLNEDTMVHAGSEWTGALSALGVPCNDSSVRLAVGAVESVPDLLAANAPSLLIEGDARRVLRRAGYDVNAVIALPDAKHSHLLLSSKQRAAAAYALKTRVVPRTKLKKLRRDVAAWLILRGMMPPVLPQVTIGTHGGTTPFLVAAAERELQINNLGWFLLTGAGDALSRAAFFLFPPEASVPGWVLKFARVRGYDEPFAAEEAALHTARALGAVVTDHAPTPTALLNIEGRTASIQTAGRGERLDSILASEGREEDKIAVIERVLDWLLKLAAGSRAPRTNLNAEWVRIRELAWAASLRLPTSPFFDPVLVHNDLGGWNIVVEHDAFTAVDWESSQRYGAPLWDLWYFLVHVLPLVAGVGKDDVDAYLVRLFRGEDQWSHLLFDWTRRAAAEAGIAPGELGTLATLCWLHHAASRNVRTAALESHVPEQDCPALVTERLPSLWLDHEGLGLEWRCLAR